MQLDTIESALQNPIVLAVVAAAAVIVIGLAVWLFIRSRRNQQRREAQVRAELVEMERENQFTSAAEHVQFQRTPEEVAVGIANLFQDYLGMPLLATYVGRESDQEWVNLLALTESQDEESQPIPAGLPQYLPSTALTGYKQPQVLPLRTIAEDQPGSTTQPLSEDGRPDETRTPSRGRGEDVMVLPWSGAFGWQGAMIARPQAAVGMETLTRHRETLNRLTDRLAVALEFEKESSLLEAEEGRSAQAMNFARALIAGLNEPSPFAAVTREAAGLLGADSAALWRVEDGGSMLRMIAEYGLKSAEFLPLPVGQGLAGSVAMSGETLALDDAPSDERCLFPREARESGIISYLGAAIVSDNTLGVIEVHSRHNRQWGEEDRRAIEAAAALLSESMRANTSRGSQLRVEGAYLKLSEAMQRLRSKDEVMDAAVEVLGHALGVSRAMIIEFDGAGRPLPVKHEYLGPNAQSAVEMVFPPDILARYTAEAGSGSTVSFTDSRAQSLMTAEAVTLLRALSELAAPVEVKGEARGLLYIHQCDRLREWQLDEAEFVDRVARQMALSLSNIEILEDASRRSETVREDAQRAADTMTRAQALINALPEAIVGFDRERRLNFFNNAARDWFKLKNEDLGRAVTDIEALALTERSLWGHVLGATQVSRIEAQLSRGGAQASPGEGSAAAAPVTLSVAPIRNAKGEIINTIVVINDLSHIGQDAASAAARVGELEKQLAGLEQALAEAREAEGRSRAAAEQARSELARAQGEGGTTGQDENGIREQLSVMREDSERLRHSAQQLLDINRLKSEFIVNAGRELESSLQSLMGFTELLGQGSYGPLTAEQSEALKGMVAWANRLKTDIDWMIEYGSTRSRRLQPGEGEDMQASTDTPAVG